MLNFLRKNKFVISAIATAIVFIGVIIAFHSMDGVENKKVVEYIEGFGWDIEQTPVEISHLTIPQTFDVVFESYNQHQKEAGFDLTSFKGVRVKRYSYRVFNHRYSDVTTTRANVLVLNGEIVAADISSTDFIHAINDTQWITE